MLRKSSCLLFLLCACVSQPATEPPLSLASDPPAPIAPSGVRVDAPLRRLTRAQYDRTVKALLAPLGLMETAATRFPADETSGPFLTNIRASVSSLEVELSIASAASLGDLAVAPGPSLTGCTPIDRACVVTYLEKLGRLAWRRPISASEQQALEAIVAQASSPTRGLSLGVEAIFAAPSFLYMVETGVPLPDGRLKLDGPSIATRLAFFFWNQGPDDALLLAAEKGQLEAPEGVAAQAWRLLKDPRSREQLGRFHLELLGMGGLDGLSKDPARYPFFDATVRSAMKAETIDFAEAVVRRSDGSLKTLLTAPFSAVQGPLFRIYGMFPTDAQPGALIGVDPTRRGGLLTQPAFLASNAGTKLTSPTHRGLNVVTNLLCMHLGAPPPDVDTRPIGADATGTKSRRQLVEQHSTDARCAGCHRLMDPIGLAFEHYDAVGAWRETDLDDKLPIDSKVELNLSDPALDGEIAGARELSLRLGDSKVVQACYARQWYRFALGRLDDTPDSLELAGLSARFDATAGNIPDLLVAIATSDAFRTRLP